MRLPVALGVYPAARQIRAHHRAVLLAVAVVGGGARGPLGEVERRSVAPDPAGAAAGQPQQAHPDLRHPAGRDDTPQVMGRTRVDRGQAGPAVQQDAIPVRLVPGGRGDRDQVAALLVTTPAGRILLLLLLRNRLESGQLLQDALLVSEDPAEHLLRWYVSG